MVQIFYNSSESGTRGAKVRVLCQMKRVADTDQSFAPSSQESCRPLVSNSSHFRVDLVTGTRRVNRRV